MKLIFFSLKNANCFIGLELSLFNQLQYQNDQQTNKQTQIDANHLRF